MEFSHHMRHTFEFELFQNLKITMHNKNRSLLILIYLKKTHHRFFDLIILRTLKII